MVEQTIEVHGISLEDENGNLVGRGYNCEIGGVTTVTQISGIDGLEGQEYEKNLVAAPPDPGEHSAVDVSIARMIADDRAQISFQFEGRVESSFSMRIEDLRNLYMLVHVFLEEQDNDSFRSRN
jgi:hypothetical protein